MPSSVRIGELRIAVLCGGPSSEREISLKSGRSVHQALRNSGSQVELIVVDHRIERSQLQGFDFCFIALHGEYGEDGQLQSQLEDWGVPYSGSGPNACKLSLNKASSHRIFDQNNINHPDWMILTIREMKNIPIDWFPVFMKPINGGSSIDVYVAKSIPEAKEAFQTIYKNTQQDVIVERALIGREFTVALMGQQILHPLEIKHADNFYSFNSKYCASDTQYVLDHQLSIEQMDQIKTQAHRAMQALGVQALGRADIILQNRIPYVLEVNTIPGMTSHSLLPKICNYHGIDYNQMCLRIIEESLRVRKKALRRSLS